jgi:hypothetical protein
MNTVTHPPINLSRTCWQLSLQRHQNLVLALLAELANMDKLKSIKNAIGPWFFK